MSTHPPAADPVALVDALDPDAIAARLDEIDRESKALRVLLRAARARRAAEQRRSVATHQAAGQGVAHAS
jgi:hypothetical protein